MIRAGQWHEQRCKTPLDPAGRRSGRCSHCEHLHGGEDARLPSPCHGLKAATVTPARDHNESHERFPVKHETAIRAPHGIRVVHEAIPSNFNEHAMR